MSSRSVLDYVQIIMDDMTSDSVNSITDTLESQRVASILRRTYFDLAAEFNLPTSEELFVLTALGDPTKPTHMDVPTNVQHLHWIRYDMKTSAADTQLRYSDVDYMDPDEFFKMVSSRNSTASNMLVVEDPTNIKLIIRTDHNPTYWTSFDGDTVVFDSYNSAISASLEASKIVAHGRVTKSWTHDDTFIPDIPDHMEATFLAIAEERAFAWIKQQENRVTADNARRYRISGRSDKNRLGINQARYPDFGKKT